MLLVLHSCMSESNSRWFYPPVPLSAACIDLLVELMRLEPEAFPLVVFFKASAYSFGMENEMLHWMLRRGSSLTFLSNS